MRSKMVIKIVVLILCTSVVLVLTGDLSSAAMGYKGPKNMPNHKKSTKSILGEVSVIRPTYIGIITYEDKQKGEDFEMLFILDEDVAVKKKELAELQEGDQVKITYENVTKPDPEDLEKDMFVMRITKEIHFLRSESKGLSSGKK